MFMTSGYSAQTRRTPSATQHHHRRAEVRLRRRDGGARLRAQPGGGALELELGGGEGGQLDGVALGARAAVGRDGLADALEHDQLSTPADRDGKGQVAPAVALPDVR